VSVGRPIGGVELLIATHTGAAAQERDVGESWASSPFNFTGYYNNPQQAQLAIADG
jgi:long-subunit acyl-CoA synthetase (AMP-forming)